MARIILAMAVLLLPLPLLAQDEGRDEKGGGDRQAIWVAPYIEASQVLSAELSPGDDVLTWTQIAAGVDAGIAGRNSAASASLRYEHRIGYGDAADTDTLSGLARASVALVPRRVTIEAGALASRTSVAAAGFTSPGEFGDDDATSQLYSIYAGPSAQTNIGEAIVTGAYRIGYTRVEAPDAVLTAPGAEPADIFDDSLTQAASVRAGFAPGTVLPVGVGVGAGWNRQDVSNLDQRVDDKYVRADVTVPVSPNVALVGGVGYEEVEVSSRDAVRDADGRPVIGPDGRFVTDEGAPRLIAYETDGLIWDVGVMWRPSRRTALEAHVGRRYGSTTYYGSLSYAPDPRTSFNLGVYDNITGFGGIVTDALADLSSEFEAFRNPITGDLGGCVASLEDGACALARLGSVRSAVFRGRGVTASLSRGNGRTSYGIAGGYDRRAFIAAAGTVLAGADGVVDENLWLAVYAAHQLDRRSGINANLFANWFDSGFDNAGGGAGYSAALAYYRHIIAGLTGTAAIGLDGITRDDLPDITTASALVGLRYTF